MKDAGQYTIHAMADFGPSSSLDWPYRCAMGLFKYPVDEAISEHLAFMGETSDVDRAWMIEYRPDMLRFRNTHEWCRGQTTPFIEELQEAPTTLIAWLHRYMVKGYAVAIADVNTLPRTARVIQAEFLRQGNKSILSVPIFHDKKLRGLIGFDTTIRYKVWPTEGINALHQCANLIGQAKYSSSRNQHRTRSYESTTPTVYLNMRGLTRGVQPESIVGVRSAGNYSEVWLEDGTMVLDSRALGVWSALLPQKFFFRIHRTAIVNALHVMDIDRRSADKWLIRMRSVTNDWPVSRPYRKYLRVRMGI